MKIAGQTSPLVALATALVGVAVSFGIGLSLEQGAAIVAAVTALAAVGPLVSGWFTRGRVYAPATVAGMMDAKDAQIAAVTAAVAGAPTALAQPMSPTSAPAPPVPPDAAPRWP